MEYTKLLGKVTLTCDGKHDSSKQYDRLCLVYDNDYKSFISIKEVPVNISITNKAYWQPVSTISADGEDIMVDYDFNLKFADKEYVPNQFSGLGRKLLRKRIVNNINLLQQSDINRAGTIYRIQYDYNLQGQTIQIPENCVLFFDGGSISNGTIVLNNTLVLPQCLDIAKNIKCNISGNYQNGQIYYDSTQDKLIAVIGQKLVDLSEKGSGSSGSVGNYTWIRYANNASGLNMTMQPQADTTHIGIAENQAVETPSSNPVDYTWILFKGPQGEQGKQGERGIQGPPGEKGEPGKDGTDGKPGESVKPNWNTWVFKQSELQPSKPNFFIPTPGAAGIDGWFDGPGSTGRWWMSMGLVDGSTDTVATWTDPVQCTGEDGKTNSYMDFKYAKSAAETIPPPLDRTVRFPEGWTDEPPTLIKGEFMWMINALIDENGDLVDKWVGPIRITGESGPQGEPGEGLPGVSYKTVFAYKSSEEEPEKPVGGSWDSETNEVVYPEGWQGNDQKLTPPIWMSDRTFTSNPDIVEDWSTPIKISGADGKPGADGKADEFIYKRTATAGDLDRPDTPTSEQIDDYVPTDLGWTDNPRGVTTTYQGEWVSTRSKKDGKWGPFSQPALWSKWGSNGQDGDGVQYIFYRTTTNNDPDNPTPNNTNSDAYQETGDFEGIEYIPGGWSDDPIGVTKEYPYEWVCQRKFRGGRWRAYTGPSLWAKYGKDGLDGLGSIVLDLDNEIQSVATDSLGNVVGGLPLKTTLSMYYGTVQLNLSSLTVRPPEGVVATADRQSGIITVTSIANTTDTTIRIPIDASTVYNNELMERTTYLTINKIKPGADGEDAILYSLMPSVDAIHVDKKGVSDVVFITCGIKKTQGANTVELSQLPNGYAFKYVIDEELAENYTIDQNISTSSIKKKIIFMLTNGGQLVDKETIYKISDGKDGVDGVGGLVTDFDNDMIAVACDSEGNVVSGLPVTSTVSMYYGTTKLTLYENPTLGEVAGVTATSSVLGTITITAIDKSAPEVIRLPVSVKAVYQGNTYIREVTLTITKVKPGADGQTPKIYQLAPSVSAIHVNKNGTPSVSTVSCGIRLFEGDSTTSVESTPYGYYFAYKIDNASEMRYYANNTIDTSGIVAYITFSLYDQRNSNSILVDQETLYILKDGEDGESGSVPNWSTYVYKKSNSRPNKPTFKNPRPGTTGIDGWLDYPTTSDGQWWQCVGMVDGPKDEVQTWSEVIQLNGKNGEALDGKHTEFRFASMTKGYNPSIATTVRNPAGWSTVVPVVNAYEYLWMSHAEISADDDLIGVWDQPVRISGEDGAAGEPGVSLYTWIKYSDDQPTSDSQIYDKPNMYTKYIGLAYNQTSSVESTRYTDYEWVKWVGNDGVNGTNGLRGRLVYPAGTYIHSKTYEATDTQAPFVLQGEAFYVMNKTTTWNGQSLGVTPEQDWNSNGINATWILMDDFEAVYTKLLIADNGTLGDFVFNKEYMFSKQGTDTFGNASRNYQDFGKSEGEYVTKFNDTNTWTSGLSNFYGTYGATEITVSGNRISGTIPLAYSFGNVPAFGVRIVGLDSNSSKGVSMKYQYVEDGVYKYINITSDDTYILPASSGTIPQQTALQLTNTSSSVSYSPSITITLIPNTFNPNFQVNGNTGEVILNSAIIRSQVLPSIKKWKISSVASTQSKSLDESYQNKTLMVYTSKDLPVTTSGTTCTLQMSSMPTVDQRYIGREGDIVFGFSLINMSNCNIQMTNVLSRYFSSFILPINSNSPRDFNKVNNLIVKPGGRAELYCVYTYGMNRGNEYVTVDYYVVNGQDFYISEYNVSATTKTLSNG